MTELKSEKMNINVLRLDHRIGRDTRITTHVCLTARFETLQIDGEETLK